MITDKMTTMTPATGERPELLFQPDTEAAPELNAEEYIVSHQYLKECVDEFIDVTQDARALSERCRDYYDGKQWTDDQIRELRRRKQAPVVNNRIKVKHNGLLGLTTMRKADPKAFPRNEQQDGQAAEAATDGLRYAADKAELEKQFMAAADNFFCEGYAALHICVEQSPRGDWEITVDHIPWDRCFFDPYSRKSDFTDARGKGYMMWMDEEDIHTQFPDAPADAFSISEEMVDAGDTFDDRPSWYISNGTRKRHLVATHYFKYKNVWHVAVYTGSAFLVPPMVSYYQDEYGQPECPVEMVSAYTDRENNRYGELAAFLDLQDEINHRRSKALFLLSQRQTYGNRGAIKDIKKTKSELAKPDGHIEIGQGEFGKDFGILPTGDMAQGQLELLQEAKAEIDAASYNAQLAGDRQQGQLSGIAINKLQQADIVELNGLFDAFASFRLRVYRQMWYRIRQFWDQEKWVRVTDDEKKPRWVGFNVPVPAGEFLQETMDDDSKPYEMRLGAAAQMELLEKQNPQALAEPITVKNRPAELDMDIILDESYDTINTSQEQLEAIMQYGAQNAFELTDLLEISSIRGKDKLIEKLNSRKREAAEAATQGAGQDPQAQYLAAKSAEAVANAEVKKQDAAQTALETQMLQQQGSVPFKGSVSA